MAGDPHQLGPVLRSTPALAHGLGMSLLERLMARDLFQRDEEKFADHGSYDPLLVSTGSCMDAFTHTVRLESLLPRVSHCGHVSFRVVSANHGKCFCVPNHSLNCVLVGVERLEHGSVL